MEELTSKNESLKSENQKLKLMNKFLLEREYSQNSFNEITDICWIHDNSFSYLLIYPY